MDEYRQCLEVMKELFSKDLTYSFATVKDNVPSLRVIDAYYDNEAFWIVTYSQSRKVIEIENNPHAALCNNLYSFQGKAFNAGHPLNENNKEIREKIIKVFHSWYFDHNDENDEHMCYVKFVPQRGFFYKNGTGYKPDFIHKKVEKFPFENHIDV